MNSDQNCKGSESDKSDVRSFLINLALTVTCLILVASFYGAAVQYVSRPTTFYLILLCISVVACFQFIPKFKKNSLGRKIATCVGSLILASLLFFSWKQGEWHDLYERVTCSLKLDCCLKAREWRISHHFAPLHFVGFNDQFSSDDLRDHLKFCRSTTGIDTAEVAYFELRREKDLGKEIKVTYVPVSKSPSWKILVNDPKPFNVNGEVKVHPGYLIKSGRDRVTRSPLTFHANSTRIGIRICGKPYSPCPPDGQTIQDTDVAFWKFVSLEQLEVK